MTMIDLGPERPGPASDTRQMSDLDRATTYEQSDVSGRQFWIAFAIIVVAVAVFAFLLMR